MRGADVGTNLIDGHDLAQDVAALITEGADVGTNLIDGHTKRPHMALAYWKVPTSAPT